MEIPIKKEKNKTIHPVMLIEYLDWASKSAISSIVTRLSISSINGYDELLLLPSIQRGFVWKPKQIQDLWDSLLRKMPVGSLLVQRFEGGYARSTSNSNEEVREIKAGWYLLDGQQRTIAMLLGFPRENKEQFSNDKHKLWVDFNEDGNKYGKRFQFRVTTQYQPFGYRPDGGRWSLEDRRKAREQWSGDKDAKKDAKLEEIFNDEATRPWKSGEKPGAYFSVRKLWKLMEEKGYNVDDWLKDIIAKTFEFGMENESIEARIKEFGNSLINLKEQSIALIEVEKTIIDDPEVIANKKQDPLTLLFERVSRSGTPLSSEDLLFAMIKQAWPEAHNLVNELHKKVGIMLTPTDFVMTAFRLAALRFKGGKKIKDNPSPRPDYFHSHLRKLLGIDGTTGILKEIIENNSNGSSLVEKFEILKKTISYNNKDYGDDDIGLPSAYLPMLDRPLLQVLLDWSLDAKDEIIEESRKDLIRFILFWMVARKDSGSALKASTEIMEKRNEERNKERNTGIFQAKKYYQMLIKKNGDKGPLFNPLFKPLFKPLINPLINPDEIEIEITESEGNGFLKEEARAKRYFGKGESDQDLYLKFTRHKQILLWLQRKWIHKQYPDEKVFLSDQDEDSVPYDYDHLVPKSNWVSFQGGKKPLLKGKNEEFCNLWARRSLGNSIGNYRVMNASDNRSRGKVSLSEEIRKNDKDDYWSDYAFGLDKDSRIECWRKASPENKDYWDDERVSSFQIAVETRVIYLYKRLFGEVDFKQIIE